MKHLTAAVHNSGELIEAVPSHSIAHEPQSRGTLASLDVCNVKEDLCRGKCCPKRRPVMIVHWRVVACSTFPTRGNRDFVSTKTSSLAPHL